MTWSALVERLFALERQAGRLAGRWLPDSAARLVWERIVERDPATAGLVSPGLLGRPAYESWRCMHAYQIPPEVTRRGRHAGNGRVRALGARSTRRVWTDTGGWTNHVPWHAWTLMRAA